MLPAAAPLPDGVAVVVFLLAALVDAGVGEAAAGKDVEPDVVEVANATVPVDPELLDAAISS